MNARLDGFFCELRRCKVYRVAVGYGVVSWQLIQVAARVFPALQLPAWTLRAVIVVLLARFPVALVLAWAFDVGPHGIRANSVRCRTGTGLPASARAAEAECLSARRDRLSNRGGCWFLPAAAAFQRGA